MISSGYGAHDPLNSDADDFAYNSMLLNGLRGAKLTVGEPTITPNTATGSITFGPMTSAAVLHSTGTHGMYTRSELQAELNKAASDRLNNTARQVGGTHYTKLAIDPFRYALENKLDPLQFSVIKYVTRFRDKGGIQDLNKAIDCLHRLIAHEQTKDGK